MRHAAGLLSLALLLLLAGACDRSPTEPLAITLDRPSMLLVTTGASFTQVSADGHNCALESDGSLACWGWDKYGQVNGAPTGTGFTQVSAGGGHTCAVESDGSIACWGSDLHGQVSDAPTGTGYTQVSAGNNHTCALDSDDSLVCWGYDGQGQVGGAPTWTGYTQVSAGGHHTCGVRTDGSLACWGYNFDNQVRGAPTGTGYTQVSAGGNHTCAVRTDGFLACWGFDGGGQVSGALNLTGFFTQVSAGGNHTCALESDGSLACWGYDYYGQVGGAPTGTGFTQVSAGWRHTCALRSDGSIACWGSDDYGAVSDVPSTTTTTILPTATFNAPASVPAGSGFTLSLTDAEVPGYTGPVTFTYAFACGDGSGYGAFSSANSASCTAPATGPITVKGTVKDEDGDTQEYTATVSVTSLNTAPVASVGGPYSGGEGAAVSLALDGTDADDDPLSYTWDLGDGTTGSGSAPPSSHTYLDDGIYTITLVVNDGATDSEPATTTATISNVAPDLGVLSPSTLDPLAASVDAFTLSADFTDPGVLDTHAATIDWGDGTRSDPASVTQDSGSGTVSGSHTYTTAGVYAVSVTLTDDDGGSDTEVYEYVVVYDPSAGFVTGNGWIDSPPGAYNLDASLTGKANFGFVSRYKKGASVPSGSSQFLFRAGGMNFHSDVQEWLVVNQGGTNAQLKGVGTINGAGSYKFMIWAGDNSPDTFRIKIWEEVGGVETTVYDNGFDQEISGGTIKVHRK